MFWRNNGKIVTNSDGNLLRCSECPCKLGKGIVLYINTWNRLTYTNYTDKYTGYLQQYRYNSTPDSQNTILENYQWIDTATFLSDRQNGRQRRNGYQYKGYHKKLDGELVSVGSTEYSYLYRQWNHDQTNWYFNFSVHSGLGYLEDQGTLFYGDQPLVEDYSIWTVGMTELIQMKNGSIYRTNSIKDPSFAYRFWENTSWSLANFTLNQSFVPFEQDVAPYGTQIMQYHYSFNISCATATWTNAVSQGYCKWTVEVNLRNDE